MYQLYCFENCYLLMFIYLQLSEIVKLAGELRYEDQKLAAESCHLAAQHIQSLWAKTSQTPAKKVCMVLHLTGHMSYLKDIYINPFHDFIFHLLSSYELFFSLEIVSV